MNENKYVFAVYVKKLPIPEAKTTKDKITRRAFLAIQNTVFDTVFKNLGGEKPPGHEIDGSIYFEADKETCIKNEKEFWETGTVDIIDKARANIRAKRYPKAVRSGLIKLVEKNKDVTDMFRLFCGYFQIVISTKVDTKTGFFENNKNADYFLTQKK
ncbi:hypothetical protein [Lutibacter sp.]|uniref:hypothetical protein n=1 Tax=Lutibacter sp. TaxID=1925666 RepID=UPI0034A006EC